MFNIDYILSFIQEKLENVAFRIAEEMQSYLLEEKRDYPRPTIRQEGRGITGKYAGSPRDVVDTGALVDSFSVTVERYSDSITIIVTAWDASHASKVYFGEGNIPPYPWVDIALRRIDIKQMIAEEFSK